MPPSSPVAGSREQRRARIEKTALELFRTRGFDNVTVEDVCAEAGVAPATFYRHFGTKEEVVFAYREEFAAALDRGDPVPAALRLAAGAAALKVTRPGAGDAIPGIEEVIGFVANPSWDKNA